MKFKHLNTLFQLLLIIVFANNTFMVYVDRRRPIKVSYNLVSKYAQFGILPGELWQENGNRNLINARNSIAQHKKWSSY